MDIVDQGASALVCAPTSSGKTFISNYIICKVLAESPTGVCVFVAPTKALVNQVQAQVCKLWKLVGFSHLNWLAVDLSSWGGKT